MFDTLINRPLVVAIAVVALVVDGLNAAALKAVVLIVVSLRVEVHVVGVLVVVTPLYERLLKGPLLL
jgi:hypothetical protein